MREQELEGRCGRKLGCCVVEGCLVDAEMREHWRARAAEDGNAAMARTAKYSDSKVTAAAKKPPESGRGGKEKRLEAAAIEKAESVGELNGTVARMLW